MGLCIKILLILHYVSDGSRRGTVSDLVSKQVYCTTEILNRLINTHTNLPRRTGFSQCGLQTWTQLLEQFHLHSDTTRKWCLQRVHTILNHYLSIPINPNYIMIYTVLLHGANLDYDHGSHQMCSPANFSVWLTKSNLIWQIYCTLSMSLLYNY